MSSDDSNDLPKVPDSHSIAREAELYIEQHLPPAWVVHKPKQGADYGADLRIELMTDNVATGRQVVAQVKGTRSEDELRRARVPRKTLNYLASLADPSVILRVNKPAGRIRLVTIWDSRVEQSRATGEPLKLAEQDDVAPEKLAEALELLSAQWLVERGLSPLIVAVDNEAAVRRISQELAGVAGASNEARPLLLVQSHQDGALAHCRFTSEPGSNNVRIESLTRPRIARDLPVASCRCEFLTTLVAVLVDSGFLHYAPRLLIEFAPMLGKHLAANLGHVVGCLAVCNSDELARFLRIAIAKEQPWTALVVHLLDRQSVPIPLTHDEVRAACAVARGLECPPIQEAQILSSIGSHVAARESVLSLLAEDHRDPLLLFDIATVLASAGAREEAITTLRSAISVGGDESTIGIELARLLIAERRVAEAQQTLSRVAPNRFASHIQACWFRLCQWICRTASTNGKTSHEFSDFESAMIEARSPGEMAQIAWHAMWRAMDDPDSLEGWTWWAFAISRTEQDDAIPLFYDVLEASSLRHGGDVVREAIERSRLPDDDDPMKAFTDMYKRLDLHRGGRVLIDRAAIEPTTTSTETAPDEAD